ncbi:MAG: DUF3575 domain-containing protein [Saprospiraceae bacterium]|nr:DUF3575 domain-containing protein [Saprospiraceae bacterium]
MKILIVTSAFLFLNCISSNAQFEIKTNPILFSSRIPNLGIECGVKPNLGVELEYLVAGLFDKKLTDRFMMHGVSASLRHYFTKDIAMARLYLGVYSFYSKEENTSKYAYNEVIKSFTFGLRSGYKLPLYKHWMVEGGLQFGRRFMFEGDQLLVPVTPTQEFFYKWDISVRFRICFRF